MEVSESNTKVSFQLKGGLYNLTTIVLLDSSFDEFSLELKEKVSQAPNFFRNAPVIVDMSILKNQIENIDFNRIKTILSDAGLILVGIKGGSGNQNSSASDAGIAIMSDKPNNRKIDSHEKLQDSKNTKVENKLIVGQIRSGQQVYVPGGDLTIIGSVSHGAELLADGNIHVYGSLRGRALAGINNNEEAKIFCQSIEAELVSIAGKYKVSEDIEKMAWKVPAYISYKSGQIHINKL